MNIHRAAENGNLERIQELVKTGVDINAVDISGKTPLYWACDQGHFPMVEWLLRHGANVNIHDHNGHTPLMTASRDGNLHILHHLLERGADIHAATIFTRSTALHGASYKGHLHIAQCLVKHGANICARDIYGAFGSTPLFWARHWGHEDVVNYLESMIKVRLCHSRVLHLVQTGFWDNKKQRKRNNGASS